MTKRVRHEGRRNFLKAAAAVATMSSVTGSLNAEAEAGAVSGTPALGDTIAAVNLGAWMVLEKWIVPSVFKGLSAPDEYTIGKELGSVKAAALLKRHRETWITEKDFRWIADHGLNTVRLPIGYWAVMPEAPYVDASDTLLSALQMAARHKLGVIVDLHGAPGSQNGWDHSGHAGPLHWPEPKNVDHTLQVIDKLAALCSSHSCVVGIELLNEPRWDVPIEVLKDYYMRGYHVVRKHLSSDRAAVVIHDSFRPTAWSNFMQSPMYENVILDTHMYQCFSAQDNARNLSGQINYALNDRSVQLAAMGKELPTMVGEWSLALSGDTWTGLNALQQCAGNRAYAAAQLLSYTATRGWSFWTLKTEGGGGWSLQDCVKQGWMPANLSPAS